MGSGQSKQQQQQQQQPDTASTAVSSNVSSLGASLNASSLSPSAKVLPNTTIQYSQYSEGSNSGGGGNGSSKESEEGGCPMKNADGSYRMMPGFGGLFGRRHPPIRSPESATESVPESAAGPAQQQYDVYSRPLSIDPANQMPKPTPQLTQLPSADQTSALPTERVSSTIPKGGAPDGTTWTYPSPQMFYNALARKGKLDEHTREEDMESVVALHNHMNEGTWSKVLQWERLLDKSAGEGAGRAGQPKLSRFCGRPSDLSPKAFLKHYLLGHPLPFDRHDWTVVRPDGSEVRYVIDYYHDDERARTDADSALPNIHDHDAVNSLLVDVRPAFSLPGTDDSTIGMGAILWGRCIAMPLARRGIFFPKSEFNPLPLFPSETLKKGYTESQLVWNNIQKDVARTNQASNKSNQFNVTTKDANDACTSDSFDTTNGDYTQQTLSQNNKDDIKITQEEAHQIAKTFVKVLDQCQEAKYQLQQCQSEEECAKAAMGMTVCAGQFLCPLQHQSLMDSLLHHENVVQSYQLNHGKSHHDNSNNNNNNNNNEEEMAEIKVNAALEVLGQCVANVDGKAMVAKTTYPDVFEEVLKR